MTSSLKSSTINNDIEETMDMQELSKSHESLEMMDKELRRLEEESINKPFGLFIWKNPKVFTAVLACFASTGGLLYGIDLTLISGANLYFPQDLHLSSGQESQVVSFMPLGGVLGALMIYLLNESLGRKPTIMIAAAFYTR
ncbi:Arabinose-proton symporter [Galdieria sulphuraria]|nr:Arabinose-proton symporter [Galdieria sulphuraria]